MRSSLFSGRGLGAAMAIMLAGAAFMPPITSRRQEVVPNAPGERLLPPPKPKSRVLVSADFEAMRQAATRRMLRNDKRLVARAAGGWVATDAWLGRVAVQ